MASAQPGEVVGGRYRLEAAIGQGGMAQVWRATDTTLERTVALKLLLSRGSFDRAEVEARFLREARLAASAQHPNVVSVLDFGTDDERPFMVMELLDGESFEERLMRPPQLTIAQLAPIVAQTLEGLAYVHELGIVHRDLKPGNIFLARAPGGAICPKLLDFGISRAMPAGPSERLSPCVTMDGYLQGTPQYMSPEQARDVPGIDHRTDIFSLGVVFYEALTGRLPFDSPNVGDLLILIAMTNAPSVADVAPEVGRPLSDVIARAMEREPADRWPSALAMRDAFVEAVRAAGHTSQPLSPIRASSSTIRRLGRDVGSAVTLDEEAAVAPSVRLLDRPKKARSRWLVSAGMVAAGAIVASALVMMGARTGARGSGIAPTASVAAAVPPPTAPPSRANADDTLGSPRGAEPDDAAEDRVLTSAAPLHAYDAGDANVVVDIGAATRIERVATRPGQGGSTQREPQRPSRPRASPRVTRSGPFRGLDY